MGSEKCSERPGARFLQYNRGQVLPRAPFPVVARFGHIGRGYHSYCLMINHFHLLMKTRAATLERDTRHLNGVYTQRFNRVHARVGHVYRNRSDRDRAIVDAFVTGGDTMRAIGGQFGIHYSRVRRMRSNAERECAQSKT